jgi:phenylacetate-coenzyme A ligase PaaK-like adenylate-forming protein
MFLVPNFYELDSAVQRRRSFQRLVRYLRRDIDPFHPFLRRRYRELGVDLGKLRTPDDLRRLPLVTKADLRENPQAFILRPAFEGVEPLAGFETAPPRRGMLAKYALQAALRWPRDTTELFRDPNFRERVRRRAQREWLPIHFHASSGSTGNPTAAVYTFTDFSVILRELSGTFMLPKHRDPARHYFDLSERGMSLFPGAPHLAFFSTILAKLNVWTSSFETCGGQVIPTDRQLRLFIDGGFTSLLAIPSYLVHWLRRAHALQNEAGLGPLASLKHIVLGAEPLSESLREAIRKLAHAAGADPGVQIYETMGMTEMKWWFGECGERSGLHLNPKYYYWELLDPETREPVEEGAPGVLVFSHIGWRGTALVRYWTGDLVKGGLVWNRCSVCGYTFPRIYGPICRAEKDFTKIKGTLVDLSELIETVRSTPGVRLFQAVLENQDEAGQLAADRLTLAVACDRGHQPTQVEASLRQRVKQNLSVSPDAITFEPDEAALQARLFARSSVKAEYVVERRICR